MLIPMITKKLQIFPYLPKFLCVMNYYEMSPKLLVFKEINIFLYSFFPIVHQVIEYQWNQKTDTR